jgi:hypothetical protein
MAWEEDLIDEVNGFMKMTLTLTLKLDIIENGTIERKPHPLFLVHCGSPFESTPRREGTL